ncbi:hypothetical protein ACTWKD_07570 [Halanaerobium saccharolyticum]|jgi:hypothetical protein|uniref:DUF4359 domain-containing protein n=1 Tax=Halanaerobium saccharolyticum TaxID=43595 RepID=A0A4V6PVU7_9FIRM|nr:hypothetical protein [Halanaerobium saccharolyticum]TDP98238.1 hypothetical protein C7957_10537 [Halanaerobium saccharolyticum]
MRILMTVIIVLAILLTATVTNPTREEFINWGIAEIRGQADSDIERIFGGAVAAPMLEVQTTMKDYVFFTVFTVQKAEEEFNYLGIYGTFFNIN